MTGYYYDCRVCNDSVQVKRQTGPEQLKVSFKRTVRVADNTDMSELPPDLGDFPLYKVQTYASSLPSEMVAKGGVFMPMYQREAMWLNFTANSPFAIKVYVGSINAVSGEPVTKNPSTKQQRQLLIAENKPVQDYLVVPGQLWLDGIASSNGVVKQFVATRLGDGYTVEAQVTGREAYGGLQFEITPAVVDVSQNRPVTILTPTGRSFTVEVTKKTIGANLKVMIESREGIPTDQQRLIFAGAAIEDHQPILGRADYTKGMKIYLVLSLRGGGFAPEPPKSDTPEMGIAAGGKIKQTIVRDLWPAETWHKTATIAFNMHILNADVFSKVTGLPAPETPITMKAYEKLGLPFFKLYEEVSGVHGSFQKVKSIGEIDGFEERSYAVPTKAINNPQTAAGRDKAEENSSGRNPEDISNPAGPFCEFRHVSEIEQELRGMRISGSD